MNLNKLKIGQVVVAVKKLGTKLQRLCKKYTMLVDLWNDLYDTEFSVARDRSLLNIAIGSVVLGLAISAMHHTAMHFTEFYHAQTTINLSPALLDNDRLALIVMLSSFVLCGMFLLLAVPAASGVVAVKAAQSHSNGEFPSPEFLTDNAVLTDEVQSDSRKIVKIPYEQNNVVKFLSAHNIHAV